MDFDAIVIGAGLAGMYQLYSLRRQGMNVRVFETAPEVGGTWFYNRYPGCRFDSESYSYGYSFSPELLQEWNWSELFTGQEENLRYVRYVADKFDLRKDIQFNTKVLNCRYDEAENLWRVETDDGKVTTARYIVTAVGVLSSPVIPKFPGVETFKGQSFHSAFWPEGLDVTGKRIAVIGTGASGIQIIQTTAPIVGSMTVYQRAGSWTKPLRNRPIAADEMEEIKGNYPEIFERCKTSSAAFIHDMHPRDTFDDTPEDREAFYEKKYAESGFGFWLGSYRDIGINETAAWEASAFLKRKIFERVKDPVVAQRLLPKGPFGSRRIPLETNYYEAYNRENVELVDAKETPVERVTEKGIVSGGVEREFDIIVYATGFDAFRGGLDRIEFYGVGGERLKDKWRDGVLTFMGLQMHGFPNLLTIMGPLNGGSRCNIPRCLEQNVEFISGLIGYMRDKGLDRVEASETAERDWTDGARKMAAPLVAMKYDGYATSANSEVSGGKREMLVWPGGQVEFRRICAEMEKTDYPGFEFSREAVPVSQ